MSLASDNQTEHSNATEIATNNTEGDTGGRPQRAAAKRARAHLLEWTTRLNCPPGGCREVDIINIIVFGFCFVHAYVNANDLTWRTCGATWRVVRPVHNRRGSLRTSLLILQKSP